jgi:membrane-associated protease RseP (regulator of RpoE activity)
MTIIFILLLWGFFAYSFEPSGVNYVYPQAIAGIAGISSINGNQINNFSQIFEFSENGLNKITIEGYDLLVYQTDLEKTREENLKGIRVFYDAPAINANLQGAIFEIDNLEIKTKENLIKILESYSPGEVIEIKTIKEKIITKYEIELASKKDDTAFLGIGFYEPPVKGLTGFLRTQFYKIKDPFVYYTPTWDGDFVQFIYDLLWWIVVINILVALFNMLPVSILDGGRFFYLTVWGITGNEKWGKKAFSYATWAILAILALMMARWLMLFIN